MIRLVPRWLFLSEQDKRLVQFVYHITNLHPRKISHYKKALIHRSKSIKAAENNERLEFLGDSILNAIIAEYLFHKYPYKEEGYLTELRARIVQRKHLNKLGEDMHLHQFLDFEKGSVNLMQSDILGDALEAFLGAVYLDHGFFKTRKFILETIVKHRMNIEKLAIEDTNYKGRLMILLQKIGQKPLFKIKEQSSNGRNSLFVVELVINEQIVSTGKGFNKKDAEQDASKLYLETIPEAKDNGVKPEALTVSA